MNTDKSTHLECYLDLYFDKIINLIKEE